MVEYQPFTGFREKQHRGGAWLNAWIPLAFGFPKIRAPWPPRPEASNVFVFGGSTTFQNSLPDEQTIPSYLGECAANHSRGHLAVYNFGRPGYISSQELILFQQLLNSGFVPRVAVFIDGLNDFSEIFPDGQPMYAERFWRFMAGKPEFNLFDDVPVGQGCRLAQCSLDEATTAETCGVALTGVGPLAGQ